MSKSANPGYEPGNHWVICDRCGFAVRSKKAKMTWDGLVVCPEDWEPRHPQDLVRAREDNQAATGLVRPERTDSFVSDPGYQSTAGDPDYEVPSGTF